jgi:hypothetical protein
MERFKKQLILVPVFVCFAIVGTMMNPHPAAAAGSSAVQVVPNIPFGNTVSGGPGTTPTIKVPAARHLVIETLSLQLDVTPSGSKVAAFVHYKSGGKSVTVFVPLTFSYNTPSNDFDTYIATQQVRLYADPGTSVTFTTHSPTGSTDTIFMTVSGYEF